MISELWEILVSQLKGDIEGSTKLRDEKFMVCTTQSVGLIKEDKLVWARKRGGSCGVYAGEDKYAQDFEREL